jgi:restriction endonuclease Mrr
VRGLYGLVEAERATSGLIVTTSYFTTGAVAERERLKYRMALADFDKVKDFLTNWRD